ATWPPRAQCSPQVPTCNAAAVPPSGAPDRSRRRAGESHHAGVIPLLRPKYLARLAAPSCGLPTRVLGIPARALLPARCGSCVPVAEPNRWPTTRGNTVPLDSEIKREIISAHATGEGDTGSPEGQIALLSKRINGLTEPLKR